MRITPTKLKRGYDSIRAGVLSGGDSGPAINLVPVPAELNFNSPAPGSVEKIASSLLIQAIRHEGGLAMPPESAKLSDATIADFEQWVRLGLPHSQSGTDQKSPSNSLEAARSHWAFQPVGRPIVPTLSNGDTGSPIDAFILEKLNERHWAPAPSVGRAALIRRVSFDLIGLPPSPAEIEDFVNDERPDAYPRLVDRLLSSPLYGERWAQHWLDVVRYAETEGYEYDRHIPDAWRYRDYVVDSLNTDKPYDRFLTEQIAGDELEPADPTCLVASIFHRLGPVRRNAGNPEIALSRNEILTERTDIVGATFLGLTVGCARCHNHKLEPILQKDYYRLQAYFAATEEHNLILASIDEQQSWETTTKQTKEEIATLRKQVSQATADEKSRLNAAIELLEERMPAPLATIPGTRNDMQKRTPIHVLRRGVWENKGEPVGARPLSVLVGHDLPELAPDVATPRTQLAKWLTSPEHPLTARVFVNRLWQQHFGVGLVKTANDFGLKGERPSHPELLDWLAATLKTHDWKSKPLHRAIVQSDTYQQANLSLLPAQQEEQDPENRLLSHYPRRRLSAEEIRDAMLFVSGRITLKTGGPSVIVPVDPELVQLLYKPAQWAVTKDAREHDRRSIYLLAKRNLRLPFLENLDAPALQTSCARRESSTHAPQALELLNGSLSNDLANAFARRLELEAGSEPEQIATQAFQLALGRSPRPDEQSRSVEFLREQPLSEFALALFNLNEFLYVP